MSHNKLTIALRSEIVQRVKSGEAPKLLAEEYGIAERNVYLLCKRRGVKLPSVVKRDALDAKIVSLRAKRLTYAKIAEQCDCSTGRVFQALRRAGVTR